MIGLPSRGSASGRSGMVRPVHPVSEISTASSRSVSGVRGSLDVQLSDPASTELPLLTRCVHHPQIENSRDRCRSAPQTGLDISVARDVCGVALRGPWPFLRSWG